MPLNSGAGGYKTKPHPPPPPPPPPEQPPPTLEQLFSCIAEAHCRRRAEDGLCLRTQRGHPVAGRGGARCRRHRRGWLCCIVRLRFSPFRPWFRRRGADQDQAAVKSPFENLSLLPVLSPLDNLNLLRPTRDPVGIARHSALPRGRGGACLFCWRFCDCPTWSVLVLRRPSQAAHSLQEARTTHCDPEPQKIG